MSGSSLGPLAHALKLKMVYPRDMKEKRFKRALALVLALCLGLLWPGQVYQALAKDVETNPSVEPVPALSGGLNSEPVLPNFSESEFKSPLLSPLALPVSEREISPLPDSALEKEPLNKVQREATPAFVAGGLSGKIAQLLPVQQPKGAVKIAQNSILGRLNSRLFGNNQASVSGSGGFSQGLSAINHFYDGEGAVSKNLPRESVASAKVVGSWRSGLKKAAFVSGAAGASAALAVPAYAQALHHVSAASGAWNLLAVGWPLFARGAYWVSMGLGFIMAIPELHELIKKRSYNWRTYGVIAANLMVGLVVAPAQTAADKFLWGSECLSVSAVLAAGIMLAKFLPKEKNREPVSQSGGSWIRKWFSSIRTDRSLQMTLALAPILIAAGFGMYFGVAAFMPSLISAVFPIPLSLVSAGIQVLVQGFYLSLFVPDLMAIRRGEKPAGFAPGFVLIFCLIAACFVIWGGTQALQNPAKHIDLVLVAASNVLQFLFSFITYRALKRPDSGKGFKPAQDPRLTENNQGVFKGGLISVSCYA